MLTLRAIVRNILLIGIIVILKLDANGRMKVTFVVRNLSNVSGTIV